MESIWKGRVSPLTVDMYYSTLTTAILNTLVTTTAAAAAAAYIFG